MKKLLTYIVKLLVATTTPNYLESILATAKLSLILTPFLFIWEKITNWSIGNSDYILIVMGAILVDYISGTIKHVRFTKDFNFKSNIIGFFTKLGLAVAGGFLFEGLSQLTQEVSFLETSLKIISRVIVFMYPAISAWENIYIISYKTFPPKSWMDKLNIFKESGDIKDLAVKKDDN